MAALISGAAALIVGAAPGLVNFFAHLGADRAMRMHAARVALLAAALTTVIAWSSPPPASAASPAGVVCTLTGLISGVFGKVCNLARHAGSVVGAGGKLLSGRPGSAVGELTGSGSRVAGAATTTVGLAAIATAVTGGARYLLGATAQVIGTTTRPNLTSTWFSSAYWRMAAIAALLTLPFLFAAAIHAMVRSDLALLARAAFGYLPLALLAVGDRGAADDAAGVRLG